MRVIPDVEENRFSSISDVTLGRASRPIEVPPHDREPECHAREGCRSCRNTPVFLALYAAHYRRDKFTEQNDREESKSLGEMCPIRWEFCTVLECPPGRREIDREC